VFRAPEEWFAIEVLRGLFSCFGSCLQPSPLSGGIKGITIASLLRAVLLLGSASALLAIAILLLSAATLSVALVSCCLSSSG
jgi:hypothetical protein